MSSQKAAQVRAMASEITDEALKSPSMLKTKADKKSSKNYGGAQRSPSMEMSQMGAGPGPVTNPFRFIEAALNEAKSKIEKMKNTPQILESLPDVSLLPSPHSSFALVGRKKEKIPEGGEQAVA